MTPEAFRGAMTGAVLGGLATILAVIPTHRGQPGAVFILALFVVAGCMALGTAVGHEIAVYRARRDNQDSTQDRS